MRPSLRFLAALAGLSTLCAAASLTVIAHQDKERTRVSAEQLTGGNVDAGKQAIRRDGCGGCHAIQGIAGADGKVGPSLNGIAVRNEIAGRLSNRPDHLIGWMRPPQEVDPGNGMPDLSISEREARDIAAYLYTLQSGS